MRVPEFLAFVRKGNSFFFFFFWFMNSLVFLNPYI
ncbi:unnamed protein product [Brassica oleracea]